MADPRKSIAIAWSLPSPISDHLAQMSIEHLQNCLDVDRALGCLLGSRERISEWMWWPAPWLFHCRPVHVALASSVGCGRLRLRLIHELAENDRDDGVAVAIAKISSAWRI